MNEVSSAVGKGDMQAQAGADQYLTFFLAGEEYGVDILKVQEIKGWDTVTPIPNTPDFVLGVINLRGAVVPIVDLRDCFKLDPSDFGPTTVVIVLRARDSQQKRTVGVVVDAVSEVYNVPEDAVGPAPDLGEGIDINYIKGLARVEEKMVILLDIDHLISFDNVPDDEATTH